MAVTSPYSISTSTIILETRESQPLLEHITPEGYNMLTSVIVLIMTDLQHVLGFAY